MQSILVFNGVLFLCFVHLILSSNVAMRSGMACAQKGDITVELQCSVSERIHVEQESYGAGDTNPCRFQTNRCRDVLQTSIHGLFVNCNGKQSCNETVSAVNCNLAAPAAAEVQYKCVKDSMNLCSFDTIVAAANESLYLHSPGYPYSVGMNKSCMAMISGKGIQVIIVEQSLNGGNMTIAGNGTTNLSNENMRLYNRKLTGQYSEVSISYTDRGNNRSNVWISVVGSSPMSVTINGGAVMTSPTSTLLVPVSQGSSPVPDITSQRMLVTQSLMPTSTTSPDVQTLSSLPTSALFTTVGEDQVSVTATATLEVTSKTTVTTMKRALMTTSVAGNSGDVVIALSVVCGILVVIIVVLGIYVKVVKQSRNSSSIGTSVHYALRNNPSNGAQTDDGLTHPSATSNTNSGLSRHDDTHVYDGIQRNTSEAGDEHNYGQITSSGGPLYVNSVSGGDPYLNT